MMLTSLNNPSMCCLKAFADSCNIIKNSFDCQLGCDMSYLVYTKWRKMKRLTHTNVS